MTDDIQIVNECMIILNEVVDDDDISDVMRRIMFTDEFIELKKCPAVLLNSLNLSSEELIDLVDATSNVPILREPHDLASALALHLSRYPVKEIPATFHIGTSGYSFDFWGDAKKKINPRNIPPNLIEVFNRLRIFFPRELSKKKWFDYYSARFVSLELNNTFFGTQSEETIRKWRDAAPENFYYSAKVNKHITHMTKLNNIEETWPVYWNRISILGDRLKCIEFQFHRDFKKTEKTWDRLTRLLPLLDKNYKYAFELRDSSWFDGETKRLFIKYPHTCVVINITAPDPKRITMWAGDITGQIKAILTTDWVYIRFHGSKGMYIGSHGFVYDEVLQTLKVFEMNLGESFVYYNNTDSIPLLLTEDTTELLPDAVTDAYRAQEILLI